MRNNRLFKHIRGFIRPQFLRPIAHGLNRTRTADTNGKMMMATCLCGLLLNLSLTASAQSVVGLPTLTQLDSTTFELRLRTDSAAVITVHASHDTTYASTFIFLARTEGEEHRAAVRMDRLKNNTDYYYRVFIGTRLSPVGGSFRTGSNE